MKAIFTVGDMQGSFELNEENITKAEDICSKMSRTYCNYVLGIGWDDSLGAPYVYADGPWEC